jgi:Domain of unknown function (DUF4260)
MKNLISVEEALLSLVALFGIHMHNLGLPTWLWIILFFSPDLGMVGYLINNKIGAICYNLFHHKGVALLLVAIGYGMQNEILLAIGLLLFAHSSFDRIMGYGLKYFTGFNDTHLGRTGPKQSLAIEPRTNAA